MNDPHECFWMTVLGLFAFALMIYLLVTMPDPTITLKMGVPK